jgi:hypothetical protein
VGISLYRGPVGKPGGDSLAETFGEKSKVYQGSFLDPEDIRILNLGAIWNFGKGKGLS